MSESFRARVGSLAWSLHCAEQALDALRLIEPPTESELDPTRALGHIASRYQRVARDVRALRNRCKERRELVRMVANFRLPVREAYREVRGTFPRVVAAAAVAAERFGTTVTRARLSPLHAARWALLETLRTRPGPRTQPRACPPERRPTGR